MYLYVYDEELYNLLIATGRQCLRQITDIHGYQIWVFASDGQEHFDRQGGYFRSPELHMVL